MRSGGCDDDDLVVDDRDAERRDQRRLLHERVRRVGLAVVVGVLQHDDAIAFGLAGMVRAVANAFRHPDAAVAIDVDVGRVVQHRRGRPQRDFEALRHLKRSSGIRTGCSVGRLTRLRRRRRGLLGYDGPEHEDEHQDVRGRRESRHVVSSRKARGILVYTHRAGDKYPRTPGCRFRAACASRRRPYFGSAGSRETSQPPPSAFTSCTLAMYRRASSVNAVRSSVSSSLCAVTTWR